MEPFTFEELPMAVTKLFERIKKIEKLLKATIKVSREKDDFMDIEEAAKYLRLSPATIYSKVSRHELPANKQGKRLYFSRKELKLWILQGKAKSISDYSANAEKYLRENKLESLKGKAASK